MAINSTNSLAIAFNKLSGKVHTQQNFAVTEEGISTNVQMSYSTVFANRIEPLPVTNSGYTALYSGNGIVQRIKFQIDIIPDTQIAVGRSQGYRLKLPADWNGNGDLYPDFVAGNYLHTALGKLQIVPALYGTLKPDGSTEYDPILYQTNGSTVIAKFDPINWYLDPYSGVLFIQDPPVGYDSSAARPGYLEAFLYVGDYLDDVIFDIGTGSTGTTAVNVGTGVGVFKDKIVTSGGTEVFRFKSFAGVDGISITGDTDNVIIGFTGSSGGGTITGGTNGLTAYGANIGLGGVMFSGDTNIDIPSGSSLTFNGLDADSDFNIFGSRINLESLPYSKINLGAGTSGWEIQMQSAGVNFNMGHGGGVNAEITAGGSYMRLTGGSDWNFGSGNAHIRGVNGGIYAEGNSGVVINAAGGDGARIGFALDQPYASYVDVASSGRITLHKDSGGHIELRDSGGITISATTSHIILEDSGSITMSGSGLQVYDKNGGGVYIESAAGVETYSNGGDIIFQATEAFGNGGNIVMYAEEEVALGQFGTGTSFIARGGLAELFISNFGVGGPEGMIRLLDSRTGSNQKGIEYAGDYSANFSPRSLVDKNYVTGLTTGLGVFAANGLRKVGNTILLGGDLTGNTSILGGTNNLNLGFTTGKFQITGATWNMSWDTQNKRFLAGDNCVSSGGSINYTFGDTNVNNGVFGSVVFGELSTIDANVGAAMAVGESVWVRAYGGKAFGRGTRVNPLAGFSIIGGGWIPGGTNPKTNNKVPQVGGFSSFGFYATDGSQTDNHGALGTYSAILGGTNHNIPANSTSSAIIGGTAIKVASGVTNTVHMPKVRIGLGTGGGLTTNNANNNLLVVNSTTGEIEIRLASTISGSTGSTGTTASNVGTGVGVFKQQVGDDLQFKSLSGIDGISVSGTTNDILIGYTGKTITSLVSGGTNYNIPFILSGVTGNKFGYSNDFNWNNARKLLIAGAGQNITAPNTHSNTLIAAGESNNFTGSMNWTAFFGDVNNIGGILNNSLVATTGSNFSAPINGLLCGAVATTITGAGIKSGDLLSGSGHYYSSTSSANYNVIVNSNNVISGVSINYGFVSGLYGHVYKDAGFVNAYGTSTRPVISNGIHAINMSSNNASQTLNHGANANYSTIIGGINHNIASGSTYSGIFGGDGIKVGTGVTNTVHFPKIRFGLGNNASIVTNNANNNLLVVNSTTGEIEIRLASTISGGTGSSTQNIYSAKRIVTGSTSLTGTDFVLWCNAAAAITLTAPASPVDGQVFKIKDVSGAAGTNNITIDGNGKNIDGSSTITINTNRGGVEIVYDQVLDFWSVMNFVG